MEFPMFLHGPIVLDSIKTLKMVHIKQIRKAMERLSHGNLD